MNKRLQRNAESKLFAEHDGEPWTADDLSWLQSWDGSADYLEELASFLGRTIEACREQFYLRRRNGDWSVTVDLRDEPAGCEACGLIHPQEECW